MRGRERERMMKFVSSRASDVEKGKMRIPRNGTERETTRCRDVREGNVGRKHRLNPHKMRSLDFQTTGVGAGIRYGSNEEGRLRFITSSSLFFFVFVSVLVW